MSLSVKERLKRLGIEITRVEREHLDREIEEVTGMNCDQGVHLLTIDEFKALVEKIKKKKKLLVAA